MTWVKLDDGFTDHPKVVGLSDRAFRTHVRALCYCGRFSPGVGRIPESALRQLGATPAVVKELLGVVLWEEDGDNGELYIHDFDEYHPKVDREAKVEAGRVGGLASGQARRSRKEAEAKQSASGLVEPNRTPVPDPSRPVPSASDEAEATIEADATPAPVREMRDHILSKLPLRFSRDPETVDEAQLFAQDYAGMWRELNEAVAQVKRQTDGRTVPFPGSLRKYMPPLAGSTVNGTGPKPYEFPEPWRDHAVLSPEEQERNAEEVRRSLAERKARQAVSRE